MIIFVKIFPRFFRIVWKNYLGENTRYHYFWTHFYVWIWLKKSFFLLDRLRLRLGSSTRKLQLKVNSRIKFGIALPTSDNSISIHNSLGMIWPLIISSYLQMFCIFYEWIFFWKVLQVFLELIIKILWLSDHFHQILYLVWTPIIHSVTLRFSSLLAH